MLDERKNLMLVCDLDEQDQANIDQTLSIAERIRDVIPTQRYVIVHEQSVRARVADYIAYQSRALPRAGKNDRHLRWNGPPGGIKACLGSLRQTKIMSDAFWWSGIEWPPRNLEGKFVELLRASVDGAGVGSAVYSSSDVLRGDATTLLMIDSLDAVPSMAHALIAGIISSSLHCRFMLRSQINARDDRPSSKSNAALTAKEREVFEWISRGKTSWEAAQILATSERTVKFHLSNIYAKLNVSNRAQAINVAGRRGLLNWASSFGEAA
jgi:LuxR family transcriptional regulator, quorum-sensing system regulator SolR